MGGVDQREQQNLGEGIFSMKVSIAALLVLPLLASTGWHNELTNILVIAGYLVALVALFLGGRLSITPASRTAAPLGVVLLIYAWHLATGNVASASLFLFPFYIGFIVVMNLFVLPATVSREQVFQVLAWGIAAVGLLGVPTLVLGRFDLGIVELTAANKQFVILPFEGALRSIFKNPNRMGATAFIGFACSIALFDTNPRVTTAALTVWNGALVFLAQGLAPMLGAGVVVGIYVINRWRGQSAVLVAIVVGAVLSAFIILSKAGVGPRIPIIADADFSRRGILWGAALTVARDAPIVGHGLVDTSAMIQAQVTGWEGGISPHNGYLSVLVRTGILGMSAYVVLTWGSVIYHLRNAVVDIRVISLIVGLLVVTLFEGTTIFTTSFAGVVLALSIGYLITDLHPAVSLH